MVGGRTLCTTSGDEAPRPTSSAMVRTVHIGDVGRPRDSEGDELGLVFSEVNVLEESREVAHRGPDGYTSTAPTATHCRVLPYYGTVDTVLVPIPVLGLGSYLPQNSILSHTKRLDL